MNSMSVDQQILDLEVRVAYQDKTIEQLDEVVRELAVRVERLEHQLGVLLINADGTPDGSPEDPPPHY